jgi:hypothetical protein
MSGPVANNVFRSSGVIASAAGGLSWQSVVTASTVTVSAGNGYPINTTSNTCTITLPSSAEAGDQIIFLDYARTWGTNKIIIDSNGLNYQGQDDSYTVDYDTDGQTVSIIYADATQGWIPESDVDVTDAPTPPPTQKGIFAYGLAGGPQLSMSNLINSSGVVATDTSGVGTARNNLGAASYGGDKAIYGYGYAGDNSGVSLTNLVSNSGVIAADVTGVGTTRHSLAAAGYGTDKAIFGYGLTTPHPAYLSLTNLVSNSGVVATDVTGVGTARSYLAAATYGDDKAIFGYGENASSATLSMTNLVSSSGVVAADVSGVGSGRNLLAAASFGSSGQAIFGYGDTGSLTAITNLVSNTGVVATDTTGVGTVRKNLAATNYGGDKAIFGFGTLPTVSITNLVSNSGVVASDTTGVGTARWGLKGAGYSTSA